MTKKPDEAKAASSSATDTVSNPQGGAPAVPTTPVAAKAVAGGVPDSGGDATESTPEGGQSLTLEQIRASGLDPAVYGYAPDA